MAKEFEWREDLNIGVDVIDKEHQRLFKIINKLYTFREEEKDSQWTCQEGIKYFKRHAMKHFEDEESYMASIGYEGLEHHQFIHRGFREHILPTLEQELERSNYAPEAVNHFLGVCSGWLIGHTMIEDQAIVGKHDQRWKNQFTTQEQIDIKKVITQLIFDMFHLEAHLISDTYAGEKFGNGLYYRLIWGCPQEEKKLEIFLVMEEQLLINTMGKILGLKTSKLDSMLLHATRYTFRDFVTRAMECFPDLKDYHIEQENFLSHEQFQHLMEKGEHQLSLLLDTGAGYLGYCVIAPRLLETGMGVCIMEDNATAEVAEYLEQRKKQIEEDKADSKRKILVVDDSAVICHAITKLLEPDYEVAQADSSVVAIRTVALNRPDLILLDYEMPVVNGKQTLEMLRWEKSFSDIPVIFLTGRNDPEIVKDLLSLKPAGYLLKSLKPTEIKKYIDAFFAKSMK